MKPFILLQTRPEDLAAEDEYQAFLKFGNLKDKELIQLRVHDGNVPKLDLKEYSGIFLGGGPYCASDHDTKKTAEQQKCEAGLYDLMDEVVARDFPFFGACYGIGIVVTHQKGEVAKEYVEVIGAYRINLTHSAESDPLLAGMPSNFLAYSGHKESCTKLPPGAVLLASSEFCPVHMFRVRKNIYVTQFHPELDATGLEVRINIYKDYGYFPPEDSQRLIDEAKAAQATEPVKLIGRFTELYRSR